MLPPEDADENDTEHPDAPAAGLVPNGFEPKVAYRCNLTATLEDGEGRWTALNDLTLTDSTTITRSLVEPRAAIDAACPAA